MKFKYFCLSLFTLASCSQNEIIEQSASQTQDEVKGIVMTGTDYQFDTSDSRSGVIPGQDSNGGLSLQFVWKDGDKVGIFPMASNDGSEILNEGTQVAFPMKGGTGTSSANFDGGGWAMKSQYSYAAYYPLINKLLDVDKKNIPVSYANPMYKGIQPDGSGKPFIDFGESDFMTAEVTTADDKGNISFKYTHVGAVIILHCEATAAPSKITKFAITGEDQATKTPVEFILNGHVDLTQQHEAVEPGSNIKASKFVPGDQPGDKTKTLEIKFDESYKPEQIFDVYFTMAPNQSLKGKKITVEMQYIPVSGEGPKTDLFTFVVAKDVKAGKAYRWNFPAKDKFTVKEAGTLASLVGSNYKETSLVLEGNINGDDFKFIQSLTNLESITLNKANIVEGGNPATTANHISKGLFDGMSQLTTLTLPASATSIDSTAFFSFTNAANCDLVVGDSLAKQIDVADDGTMKLGGAQFKSIKWMDADGVEKDFITIDAVSHTITTTLDGFIFASAVTEAMAGGNDLIVKGNISGRDVKSLREAAGCLYDADTTNPDITSAPLQHLDMSGSTIKKSDYVYSTSEKAKYHERTEDDVLGDYMFYKSNLHSIKLPGGITRIGFRAFSNNRNLRNVDIPNSVSQIDNGVWQQNTSLESIVIPKSVTKLGANLFSGCSNLSSVQLPDNVTFIQTQVFYNCSKLKTVKLPRKATWISELTFAFSGIENLVIPADVEVFKEGIFKGVTSLKSLTFAGTKIPMKTSDRNGFSEGFKEFKNSKNCDLVIPTFYKNEVKNNSAGEPQFAGLTWKSITFSDNYSGMGFDGVTDEDAF